MLGFIYYLNKGVVVDNTVVYEDGDLEGIELGFMRKIINNKSNI